MVKVYRKGRWWIGVMTVFAIFASMTFYKMSQIREQASTRLQRQNQGSQNQALGKNIVLFGYHHPTDSQKEDAISRQWIRATINEEIEITGADAACARCHGTEFEGGIEGATVAPSLVKGQYSNAIDFQRAVNQGIANDGRSLAREMPRYQLNPEQAGAVLTYIDQIHQELEVGVSSKEILIAVTGPDDSLAREWAHGMNTIAAGQYLNERVIRFEAMKGKLESIERQVFAAVVIGNDDSDFNIELPVFKVETSLSHRSFWNRQFSLVQSESHWLEKLKSILNAEVSECHQTNTTDGPGFVVRSYCSKRSRSGSKEFYTRWPIDILGQAKYESTIVNDAMFEDVFVKLFKNAFSRITNPPRRTAFVNALRSGEAFDLGHGVVTRFRKERSVGLDGFFIYRQSERGFEKIFRPF